MNVDGLKERVVVAEESEFADIDKAVVDLTEALNKIGACFVTLSFDVASEKSDRLMMHLRNKGGFSDVLVKKLSDDSDQIIATTNW
jgi:hypothetical protein